MYVDDLIGRTAELTGNMISEGAPEYTRAMIKPFFQWLQFSHKMILLGLPKSVGGSSMFSGVEKARIAFTQFLLFGAQATAVTAVVHKLIEEDIVEKLEASGDQEAGRFVELWRSDSGQQFMDGIMFDYTANTVAKALFGEADENWDNFSWSKTFAPGAGHDSLSERIIGLFHADPEAVLGVQMKTASAFWKYGDQVADATLARWKNADDVPFDVRLEQLAKKGGAIAIAPYGKYLANKWASEQDMFVSQGGAIAEQHTNNLQAWLATSIGVDTKDNIEYYAARKRLDEEFAAQRKDRVTDLANTYWKQLVENSTKFSAEAPSEDVYDDLLKNYINDQGLLLSALDRRDKEAVTDIIASKLQNIASGGGDTPEAAFVERMTKKLANGGFGAEGPEVANYMRHLQFIKDDPRYSIMVQNAWEEIMKEPAPQNITTNEVAQ
jgi:hypothetical protein